ncbi:MAG: Fe-S cluster assembly protein SufD [Pirellulales bacterium]|nr:Fe-S cluster assembly protein SufD [Pirellulales bacterium]
MTPTTPIGPHSTESFEQFLSQRSEPAWLTEQRRQNWALFERLPPPSRRDEEWLRTDIRLFRWDQYPLPTAGASSSKLTATPLLTDGVDLCGRTVALDSHLITSELDPALSRQGVIFCGLEQAAASHPELVQRYLGSVVAADTDRFSALQGACHSGGTFLYVPRGVKLSQPLHTLTALSPQNSDFSHLLVVLEAGAEATLLSETAGDQHAGGLHNGAIELICHPGSKLRYVNLQNWGQGTWHFAQQKALVHSGAQLQWTIAALGSRLAKVNQHVALIGPDAQTQVNGVMFTEGKQHLSYNTLQHHVAPHCQSDLLYKGALQDKSRLVWRGMIKVDPAAQKTNGYQRNDNLMLSDEARADSIPGLEIEADDVRCTHGATAGRVDQEQIFYCQTRGLTRKEAIRTVVTGFFQQVFDRITIESVRNALGGAINRRIREFA